MFFYKLAIFAIGVFYLSLLTHAVQASHNFINLTDDENTQQITVSQTPNTNDANETLKKQLVAMNDLSKKIQAITHNYNKNQPNVSSQDCNSLIKLALQLSNINDIITDSVNPSPHKILPTDEEKVQDITQNIISNRVPLSTCNNSNVDHTNHNKSNTEKVKATKNKPTITVKRSVPSEQALQKKREKTKRSFVKHTRSLKSKNLRETYNATATPLVPVQSVVINIPKKPKPLEFPIPSFADTFSPVISHAPTSMVLGTERQVQSTPENFCAAYNSTQCLVGSNLPSSFPSTTVTLAQLNQCNPQQCRTQPATPCQNQNSNYYVPANFVQAKPAQPIHFINYINSVDHRF